MSIHGGRHVAYDEEDDENEDEDRDRSQSIPAASLQTLSRSRLPVRPFPGANFKARYNICPTPPVPHHTNPPIELPPRAQPLVAQPDLRASAHRVFPVAAPAVVPSTSASASASASASVGVGACAGAGGYTGGVRTRDMIRRRLEPVLSNDIVSPIPDFYLDLFADGGELDLEGPIQFTHNLISLARSAELHRPLTLLRLATLHPTGIVCTGSVGLRTAILKVEQIQALPVLQTKCIERLQIQLAAVEGKCEVYKSELRNMKKQNDDITHMLRTQGKRAADTSDDPSPKQSRESEDAQEGAARREEPEERSRERERETVEDGSRFDESSPSVGGGVCGGGGFGDGSRGGGGDGRSVDSGGAVHESPAEKCSVDGCTRWVLDMKEHMLKVHGYCEACKKCFKCLSQHKRRFHKKPLAR